MQPEAQDEIGFSAWVSQAEPGAALTYHDGFLTVDVTAAASKLSADHRQRLLDLAAAAWRAAEQDLVHLVQTRLGPGRFAYQAIVRPRLVPPLKHPLAGLRPTARSPQS